MLDLEYDGAPGKADSNNIEGIPLICSKCGRLGSFPFLETLTAWDQILEIISRRADVTRKELLKHGSRPTSAAVSGRKLLASVTRRLAEDRSQAALWLELWGFKPRWISTQLREEEHPQTLEVLEEFQLLRMEAEI